MSTPERPTIDIRPQTLMCPAHGEHLRAQWPKGYVQVMVTLFNKAMANEALTRAVDPSWDGGKHAARLDEAALNAIFARRPMCYWVDRDGIREALMATEIGVIGRCRACGNSGIGGPYNVSLPMGVEQSWLCFECALDAGERLHAAHPNGGVWPSE